MVVSRPLARGSLSQDVTWVSKFGSGVFRVTATHPIHHCEMPQPEGQPWTARGDIGMPPTTPLPSPPQSEPFLHIVGASCPEKMLPDVQTWGLSMSLSTSPYPSPGHIDLPSVPQMCQLHPDPGPLSRLCLLLGCCPSTLSIAVPSHLLGLCQTSPPQEPLLTSLSTEATSTQALPSMSPCFLSWVPLATI